MDSPLEFLRRNQKTMLPIIAIACMVAFVVLPGLLGMLQDRHRESNFKDPVIARWQGGELRQEALKHDVREHQELSYFISRLQVEKQLAGNPQFSLPQFKDPRFLEYMAQAARSRFLQTNYGPTDLTRAAEAKMFDQMGKELGIVISDKQVNDYLDGICGEPTIGPDGKPTGTFHTIVPKATFDSLLQGIAKQDPGFTEPRMFQLVQRMLLRNEVLQLFDPQNITAAQTPLARWDNYRRIRQRSAIQAIPVRVADFVAGVREPSPEELNAFFEANKNRLPDVNSPEVGLRTPVRASFQLAYINMDRLVSSFKPRIENKAVSDYYEKNKDQFQKSKLPSTESEKTTEPKAGEAKPADPMTPETKTPETKTPETNPAETGTKGSPAAEPAKAEPAKSEPPKSEAPKGDPGKTEPTAPKQDATKKQSAVFRDGLIPVNFQADAKDAAKTPAAPATKDVGKDSAKTDPAKSEPGKGEPTKDEPAKTDATKSDPLKTEPAKTEPVEYKPLEEVESEIRETLARVQANAQADLLMQKIEDEMLAYKKRRDRAYNAAEDASKVQFEDFDMAKVTAGIDPTIEAETLTLVSRDQFGKHPVSGSQVAHLEGSPILNNVAFNDKLLPPYEPIRPRWINGRYIIWKTDQRPDEIPVLSDLAVKKRTIEAWKTLEARKDAQKQAQQYAEIAKKAEKKDDKFQTLVELHNAKVLPVAPNEIGSFSWMTPGMQRDEPPSLTKVSGLDSAGHDLMQLIFSLKQGEIGVAANQPQTFYYVVQVTETDDLTKLRDSFLQDVRTPGGWQQFASANINEQYAEYRSFFEKLRQRYKLEILDPAAAAQGIEE
jgi:hypothetical protein